MLFDERPVPPAAPSPSAPRGEAAPAASPKVRAFADGLTLAPAAILPAAPATPLFGFPIARTARGGECGGCQQFKPLDLKCQVSGRCKLGIFRGIINRRAHGCGLWRAKGAPRRFQGRAVRP